MTNVVTEGHYCTLYISGAATTLTTEATTGSTYTWQITDTAKRVLDPTYSITESKSASYTRGTPTAGQYTVNRLKGIITYGSSQTGPVTVTGKYLPMAAMLYAKDFTLNIKPKVAATTAFSGSAPYESRKPTIRDISGTIGDFFTPDAAATFSPAITDYFANAHLMSNATFALKFYMSANYELVAWVKVDTDAIKANVGALMEETVSFSGIPDAEGRVLSQV